MQNSINLHQYDNIEPQGHSRRAKWIRRATSATKKSPLPYIPYRFKSTLVPYNGSETCEYITMARYTLTNPHKHDQCPHCPSSCILDDPPTPSPTDDLQTFLLGDPPACPCLTLPSSFTTPSWLLHESFFTSFKSSLATPWPSTGPSSKYTQHAHIQTRCETHTHIHTHTQI